jgi:hypothetical protein
MARAELRPNFDSAKPLEALGLTPREAEVLLWITIGRSAKELFLGWGPSSRLGFRRNAELLTVLL